MVTTPTSRPATVCPTRVGMGRESLRLSHSVKIVCPTRVGMGRSASKASCRAAPFAPRVWGWAGRHQRSAIIAQPFAPRVWGWAVVALVEPPPVDRLPHACGDGPSEALELSLLCTFAPRVWGWAGARPGRGDRWGAFAPRVWGWAVVSRGHAVQPRPFAPRVWGWAACLAGAALVQCRLPHACGDGPGELRSVLHTYWVCPTRVGMGRAQ